VRAAIKKICVPRSN